MRGNVLEVILSQPKREKMEANFVSLVDKWRAKTLILVAETRHFLSTNIFLKTATKFAEGTEEKLSKATYTVQ